MKSPCQRPETQDWFKILKKSDQTFGMSLTSTPMDTVIGWFGGSSNFTYSCKKEFGILHTPVRIKIFPYTYSCKVVQISHTPAKEFGISHTSVKIKILTHTSAVHLRKCQESIPNNKF